MISINYGFPPDVIANMSFPQLYAYAEGKTEEDTIDITSPAQWRQVVAQARKG